MKNKNIEYGNIEVDKDLESNPKVRTTIFLDLDLKEKLKQEFEEKGIKYQQLVRNILRNHFSTSPTLEERVRELEKAIFQKSS